MLTMVSRVCRTTGVQLRGPEGAQRPRASSAATAELGGSLVHTISDLPRLPFTSVDLPRPRRPFTRRARPVRCRWIELPRGIRNADAPQPLLHAEGPRALRSARLAPPFGTDHDGASARIARTVVAGDAPSASAGTALSSTTATGAGSLLGDQATISNGCGCGSSIRDRR